jgi:hypothetical protein
MIENVMGTVLHCITAPGGRGRLPSRNVGSRERANVQPLTMVNTLFRYATNFGSSWNRVGDFAA